MGNHTEGSEVQNPAPTPRLLGSLQSQQNYSLSHGDKNASEDSSS